MNKNLCELIKNNPSFKRLLQDISCGRLTHAQLICSGDEIFAKTFCEMVIQNLLIANNLAHLAQKIENGNFLDILTIENPKSIKVEDLLPLLEKSSERGIESDFKFYIILGAEKMTTEAQNKLLKTLEEPNPNQYYFLCTSSRFLVLPTIVSRANVVEIEPLQKQEIERYLVRNFSVSNEAAVFAAEISCGNVSEAENLLKEKNPNFNIALDALCNINSSADCIKYVQTLQKSALGEVFQFAEILILDALKLQANSSEIWFLSKKEQLSQIAQTSQSGLIFVYDKIQNLKELMRVNVSPIVLADKFALSIAEGKHI